jgi:DNA adenine methylase
MRRGSLAVVEAEVATRPLRPPLKWAGGKRWQVPHLAPIWAAHANRRLVEPFCGGMAVTMSFRPERALLNDINPHVINFYRWVQRGLVLPADLANSRAEYYERRTRFNQLVATGGADTSEAAALFYYLNRTGYNGLCRFNRSGRLNVPFGRYTRISYTTDFATYRAPFSSWEFANVDFERLRLDPEDFVFADPPYDVEFTQYSQQKFDWGEQERVAEWLALHPGPVVLANQFTERIGRLYKSLGFTVQRLAAPRRISCTGDRAPAVEVLAFRNISLPDPD